MAGKKPLNDSLDRMRENLAASDETIETVRSLMKAKGRVYYRVIDDS